MTSIEKQIQFARCEKWQRLMNTANAMDAQLKVLRDTITANASSVKVINEIVIYRCGAEPFRLSPIHILDFKVGDALQKLLEAERDELWKEAEKL